MADAVTAAGLSASPNGRAEIPGTKLEGTHEKLWLQPQNPVDVKAQVFGAGGDDRACPRICVCTIAMRWHMRVADW